MQQNYQAGMTLTVNGKKETGKKETGKKETILARKKRNRKKRNGKKETVLFTTISYFVDKFILIHVHEFL